MSSESNVQSVWHYTSNGERRGPIALDELKEMATSGRLRTTDKVWTDGMKDWQPARDVSELQPLFPKETSFDVDAYKEKAQVAANRVGGLIKATSDAYLAAKDDWADERLAGLIGDGETVLFRAKGRVETRPPSLFGTIAFWVGYIAINYYSFIFTLRARITAQLIFTNRRVFVLTNNAILFPLWKFECTQSAIDLVIRKDHVASIAPAIKRSFWIIKTVGVTIETVGGSKITFNGLSMPDFCEAKRCLNALVSDEFQKPSSIASK